MARDTDNNATSVHPNFINSIVMLIKSVDPKSGLYTGRIGIVVAVHVSQPVFRGTEVFRGANFSAPRKDKKNKKQTSSN